jgi:hypothetical protein
VSSVSSVTGVTGVTGVSGFHSFQVIVGAPFIAPTNGNRLPKRAVMWVKVYGRCNNV